MFLLLSLCSGGNAIRSNDYLPLIFPDGQVAWSMQSLLTTSCKIDARFFPFDTQTCTLRFGSWVYSVSRMDFTIAPTQPKSIVRQFYTDNGIWRLDDVLLERICSKYIGYPEKYPQIDVNLKLSRRPLFYVLVIIVPCTLLSLINLTVFTLPTESGEKVSLGITNYLALVLILQLIGDMIPPASDGLPVIICEILQQFYL